MALLITDVSKLAKSITLQHYYTWEVGLPESWPTSDTRLQSWSSGMNLVGVTVWHSRSTNLLCGAAARFIPHPKLPAVKVTATILTPKLTITEVLVCARCGDRGRIVSDVWIPG